MPARWPYAVGGFAAGCLVTAGSAGGLYYGWLARPSPGEAAAADRPVFNRDEFSRRVLGKPEADVLAAVGPPDSTTEDGGTKFWHYKRRTRDPLADATDTDVQVVLEGGKVTAINY